MLSESRLANNIGKYDADSINIKIYPYETTKFKLQVLFG